MTPGKFTRISDEERAKLSPLRQKAVKLLEDNVPVTGLTSNDAAFERLTGYNTTKLQETWKTKPTFTTCNAFGGHSVSNLGENNPNFPHCYQFSGTTSVSGKPATSHASRPPRYQYTFV